MSDPGSDIPIELRPSAMIEASADGTWQPSENGFDALLLPVRALGGNIIDVVAWQLGAPSIWWLRRGIATFLSEAAITLANLEGKPVELVGTPREYLARYGRAVCVLSWDADLAAIEAEAENGFVCSNPKLAAHFKNTLGRQRRDAVRVEVVSA